MAGALTGKTAIVTGASSGIGRAVAEELSAAGAAVVIAARRGERLAEVARGIEEKGGKVLTVTMDAGKIADIDALVERTLAWGGGGHGHDTPGRGGGGQDARAEMGYGGQDARGTSGGKLDIVIVNAGRGLAGGMLSSDRKQWEEMYQVNVMGAAHLMRRAAEVMVKQESGDIVTLGSVAGHNISPFSGFYGSSKWALAAMTEGLRREVCGKKVRVTVIKPAIVTSEFQEVAGYTPENFGKSVARFGKLLVPGDVARAITFIVSQPEGVHINELVIRPTGQDYP